MVKYELIINKVYTSPCKNDPKQFWSYINQMKNKARIPGLMMSNDGVCDWLFFLTLNINKLDEIDIMKAIKTFNGKYTMGPDGMPTFIVKDCISVFTEPLLHNFNLILTNDINPKL